MFSFLLFDVAKIQTILIFANFFQLFFNLFNKQRRVCFLSSFHPPPCFYQLYERICLQMQYKDTNDFHICKLFSIFFQIFF